MKKTVWMMTAAAVLLCFAFPGARELFSGDETRCAGIAAEMLAENDYVVPRLNGEPFPEYPPLFFQVTALAFRIFSVCDGAAKLPSMTAAFLTALLLFYGALKLKFSRKNSLFAVLMFLTLVPVFEYARQCMCDMMLTFFTTLSFISFYTLASEEKFSAKAVSWCVFAFALAGGVMTKGIIGIAFPFAGIGTWCAAEFFREKKFRAKLYFAALSALIPAVLVTGIWGCMFFRRTGMEEVQTVFITNTFGRFSGSQGDHIEKPWFYIAHFPEFFLPWLPLFFLALFRAWKKRRELESRETYLLCTALAPVLFLSAAAGKRMVYMLPGSAMLVLFSLWGCPGYRDKIFRVWEKHPDLCKGVLASGVTAVSCVSLGTGKGTPYIAAALAALVPGLLLFIPFRKWRKDLLTAAALAAFVFAHLAADSCIFASWKKKHSLRPLFEKVKRIEKSGGKTVLVVPVSERTRGAAFYYTGKVMECRKENGSSYGILRSGRMPDGGEKFADRHWLVKPSSSRTSGASSD